MSEAEPGQEDTITTRDVSLAAYLYGRGLTFVSTSTAADYHNAVFTFDNRTKRGRDLTREFAGDRALRDFLRGRRFMTTSLAVSRQNPTRTATTADVRRYIDAHAEETRARLGARAVGMDRDREMREHQEQAEG